MWQQKLGGESGADQAYHMAGLARELFRVNREETQPLVHAFPETSRGPRRPVCPRSLGKETYSGFDMNELRRLMPIQNGSAAFRIANVCRRLLGAAPPSPPVPVGAAPGDASKGRSQPRGGAS